MLLEFTFKNFRSFKDEATLSLVKSKLRDPGAEDRTVSLKPKLSALRAALVFGANASGKSNVVSAVRFARDFALKSAVDRQFGDPILVEPYLLDTSSRTQPSEFEFVLWSGEEVFRYGFAVGRGVVAREWLFHTPTSRESLLFERVYDGEDAVGNAADKGTEMHFRGPMRSAAEIRRLTRKDALFLSTAAAFGHPVAARVLHTISKVQALSLLSDAPYVGFTSRQLDGGELAERIQSIIAAFDLGFERIVVRSEESQHDALPVSDPRSRSARRSLKTTHVVCDETGLGVSTEEFDLRFHESAGTQKIVALAGPLADVLANGYTLVADELDARLHPLLTRAIVDIFSSPENESPWRTIGRRDP